MVRNWSEAEAFAAAVDFPSHGLIVRADEPANGMANGTIVAKDITAAEELAAAVTAALQQSANGTARLETDMRALYNPTRLKVIAQATEHLLQVVSQTCATCGMCQQK